MIDIIWLSIVQGVSEFLPISSSAHLVVIGYFFNFNNENLSLDISLHLGSLVAIIYYFRKELINLKKNINLILLILVGSVPTLITGYTLVNLNLIGNLRNVEIIGWTTLVFGIILYISDFKIEKKKINNDLNFRIILFIGLFQILSLIPGVSRSGITITASRFLKFKRAEAAKISFYLSIPTLTTISVYNIYNLINTNNITISIENYFGTFLSAIFSFFTIKYLIKYLKKFSLFIFVVYRVIFGALILTYVYV